MTAVDPNRAADLRRGRLGRRLRRGGPLVTASVGLVALALTATMAIGFRSLTESNAVALQEWIPSAEVAVDPPTRSTVLASDGSLLATFAVQDRISLPLEQMAQVLRQAVLAIEDARFYEHGAIDPVAMMRALLANLSAGEVREGASTLTQQYVKQAMVARAEDREGVYKATEVTLSRKIREMGAALAVESRFDKDEILERYLNLVYFGNGAYGVEVAARRYFSTSAENLSLAQAALLAGLIRSPVGYDPVRRPDAALARRAVVLKRMADEGFVTRARADAAAAAPLGLQITGAALGCKASAQPFYCSYVVSEIRRLASLGAGEAARMQRLLTGGLTIRTTLDPKVQKAAQRAIARHIGKKHRIGTAIVMTEPGTGAVRAIALNRDWGDARRGQTKLNYALDRDSGGSSGFQAGSAFKPFVAAAALKRGIRPSTEFDARDEVELDGFRNCRTGAKFPPYEVGNYGDDDFGRIDLATATARSVNTYYVQLAERVGVCAPANLAERMGLKRADGGSLSRVPSFVLGVDEVSPLRMAEAYATLAAGGVHCRSYAITSITGPDGTEIPVPGPKCERAIPKRVADGVTHLLRGVIDGDDPRRTGARMSLGRYPAAGKTGTTNNAVAVWFAGYTAQLAAAVWAGYPEKSRPLENVTVDGVHYDQLYGGALPGPIWRDAMTKALRGEKPKGLVKRSP